MNNYSRSYLQKKLFPDKENFFDKFWLLSKLRYKYIILFFSNNLSQFLKKDRDARNLLRKIRKCPLYTRNEKLETRVFITEYLLQSNLFKGFKTHEFDKMVIFSSLVILMGCIPDTVADETYSKNVMSILGKEDILNSSMKFLQEFEKSMIEGLDGKYKEKEIFNNMKGLNEIFKIYEKYFKKITKDISKVDFNLYRGIISELKYGIKYMFKSHYKSIEIKGNYYSEPVSPIRHIKDIAGGMHYFIVIYIALLCRLKDPHMIEILKIKGSLKKIRKFSVLNTEIVYIVDGFKSYVREFVEGDFSSWVYSFLIEKRYIDKDFPKTYINSQLDRKMLYNPSRSFNLLSGNFQPRIKNFMVSNVSRKFGSIVKESEGIVSNRYFKVLVVVMRLQLLSALKEEKQQLAEFLLRNSDG